MVHYSSCSTARVILRPPTTVLRTVLHHIAYGQPPAEVQNTAILLTGLHRERLIDCPNQSLGPSLPHLFIRLLSVTTFSQHVRSVCSQIRQARLSPPLSLGLTGNGIASRKIQMRPTDMVLGTTLVKFTTKLAGRGVLRARLVGSVDSVLRSSCHQKPTDRNHLGAVRQRVHEGQNQGQTKGSLQPSVSALQDDAYYSGVIVHHQQPSAELFCTGCQISQLPAR